MELLKINIAIQCLLVILLSGTAFAVNVTFQVDMQNEEVSDGVYIVPYLGFGTSDNIQMSDEDGDKIFIVVRELSVLENLYYVFKNGSSLEENNFGNCGASISSRQHVVSNTDETVGPVCFSSCLPCNEVSVTVQVDMKVEDVAEDGIYISFQDENISSLEMTDDNSDEIYAITFTRALGDTIRYRFVNGSDHEVISGLSDCIIESDGGEIYRYHIVGQINEQVETLEPVCFGNCHDCASIALSSLTFEVNVINAVNSNGFDTGDLLLVRWGYGDDGILGENTDTLSRLDIFTYPYIYSVSRDNVIINKDYGLYYQYYRPPAGESDRELYYNFDYSGHDTNLAERRYFSFEGISEFESMIISDTEDSQVDPRRMPIYNNNEPIGQTIMVTYTVDLRPAYYQVLSGDTLIDIQSGMNVLIADSIFAWGVRMNGPATEPSGESWTSWGSTLHNTQAKIMWDDGTHGDAVSGDSIYSAQFTYNADAPIGQEFKFGIKGGDNEGGYGNNHIENINVQNANPIIASYWGSIDPIFYDAWDYDTNIPSLSIEYINGLSPHQFSLGHNYPNPFNPRTSFEFTIPHGAEVNLTIYDINGRLISTVHNAYTMPGTYKATWNGISEASGVYFYAMHAKEYFQETRKMTLMK